MRASWDTHAGTSHKVLTVLYFVCSYLWWLMLMLSKLLCSANHCFVFIPACCKMCTFHFQFSPVLTKPGNISHSDNIYIMAHHQLTHWDWVTHIYISKRSSSVQIMACCLKGDKPLSQPMLAYCYLHRYEQLSLKFEYNNKFSTRKWIWKCHLHYVGILSRSQCINSLVRFSTTSPWITWGCFT